MTPRSFLGNGRRSRSQIQEGIALMLQATAPCYPRQAGEGVYWLYWVSTLCSRRRIAASTERPERRGRKWEVGGAALQLRQALSEESEHQTFHVSPRQSFAKGGGRKKFQFQPCGWASFCPQEVLCALDAEGGHPGLGNGCTAPEL